MDNAKLKSMKDLLELFDDVIEPSDILETKAIAQITAALISERKRLMLDQKQFAEKLGVSQSLISRWENGNSNFTIKTLAEIAAKLDMSLDINLKKRIDFKEAGKFKTSNHKKRDEYIPHYNLYACKKFEILSNDYVVKKYKSDCSEMCMIK